jgi:hypothetical protein
MKETKTFKNPQPKTAPRYGPRALKPCSFVRLFYGKSYFDSFQRARRNRRICLSGIFQRQEHDAFESLESGFNPESTREVAKAIPELTIK